jgi:hypothetical protein
MPGAARPNRRQAKLGLFKGDCGICVPLWPCAPSLRPNGILKEAILRNLRPGLPLIWMPSSGETVELFCREELAEGVPCWVVRLQLRLQVSWSGSVAIRGWTRGPRFSGGDCRGSVQPYALGFPGGGSPLLGIPVNGFSETGH